LDLTHTQVAASQVQKLRQLRSQLQIRPTSI
jgi:hypothetical protein